MEVELKKIYYEFDNNLTILFNMDLKSFKNHDLKECKNQKFHLTLYNLNKINEGDYLEFVINYANGASYETAKNFLKDHITIFVK